MLSDSILSNIAFVYSLLGSPHRGNSCCPSAIKTLPHKLNIRSSSYLSITAKYSAYLKELQLLFCLRLKIGYFCGKTLLSFVTALFYFVKYTCRVEMTANGKQCKSNQVRQANVNQGQKTWSVSCLIKCNCNNPIDFSKTAPYPLVLIFNFFEENL